MVTALFLILKVCFGLNEILKEIPSNLCIFKSEWRFGKSLVTLFKEIHTCPYKPPSHLLTGERGKGIWSEEGTLKELLPALCCLTDEQHWVIISDAPIMIFRGRFRYRFFSSKLADSDSDTDFFSFKQPTRNNERF